MMQQRSNVLMGVLVAVLATSCVLLVWRPWESKETTSATSQNPTFVPTVTDCDPAWDDQIVRTFELHDQEKWDEAVAAWDGLAQQTTLCERQRDAVERHRRNAQSMLETSQRGVMDYAPPEPPAPPEKPAPKQNFLAYYPVGKTVRSTAFLHIDGEGENKFWVLAGRAYFLYQYHVNAEKTVQKNDGDQAVFEITFHEVNQLRAVSREELALRGWEDASPLLRLVWRQLDEEVLSHSPHYLVVKKLGQLANVVDPRLQRSLTALHEFARFAGFPLVDRSDVEIAGQIERFTGARLEVTFVREFGVTNIRVLEGEKISRDELAELAYNSSLLMDYFIFPQAQTKQPGAQWEVNARDIAGVVNLNFDVSVDGGLLLQLGEDRIVEGKNVAELSVIGGEVEASVETPEGPKSTTITPKTGVVLYSRDDLMIHSAELQWNMTELQMSRDHLLFGTENIINLRIQSRYAASAGSP
jgi:hypothetical protein